MLAWLLRQERPPPSTSQVAMGQGVIKSRLRDHLAEEYARLADLRTHEAAGFLDEVKISHLTQAQAEGLDEDIQIEELQEALRDMA
ncbi:hypothetical protein NDU88_000167 [Pleurodeles waltl]|uniref:Uncharacterized protein n=1 Tax=Pleurodeles waltl TaxID=8319 RepID=A0AAV7VXL7_PLEWA|nr:hypothetical protein NDU88_000167 [Pleurodeles waltl]